MSLKQLELIGFKSFAQKTTLDFPGGIVAIVGPNGSGKSNIIDAIRWMLGERETKNLRSARIEDLIFAGTPERSRSGMAEVRLHFDNSSGFFPVDFKEITVSRQIARDSSSHYFLNKAEVRLRDLVDFFAKSKLGAKGLSIINQGNSDIFVRVTPAERRAMIEEILGLREYQLKKLEAERKLKTTAINADKVRLTIDELKPHLRLLKRQTSKWEKRSEVASELMEAENQLFSSRLADIESGIKKAKENIEKSDAGIKIIQNKLSIQQKTLEKLETSQPHQLKVLKELNEEQRKLFEKRSTVQKTLTQLEAKFEFFTSKSDDNLEKFEKASLVSLLKEIRSKIDAEFNQADWSKIKQLFSDIATKIDSLFERGGVKISNDTAESIQKDKARVLKELEDINKAMAERDKKESEIAKSLESFNSEFKNSVKEIENTHNDLSLAEAEKNKHLLNHERFNMRYSDLGLQISHAGRKLSEFKNTKFTPVEDESEIDRRILKLRGELAAIGEVDDALLKEATEIEERFNFLSTQLSDLEKSSEDLTKLVKDLGQKIHDEFKSALGQINEEFNKFFRLMFNGGQAKMFLEKPPKQVSDIEVDNELTPKEIQKEIEEDKLGIEISVSLPKKKLKGLDALSGGEKSLVSIAALFALISVSPPPFLVLDEIDAALDEQNTKRFAEILKSFSKNTQFIIVTHNRYTMEVADVLYGVTMNPDGTSKVLSVKLES